MSKTVSAAIIIDCILIILTLSFIFGNSLKNVEKSSNDSEKITEIVEKLPPVQTAIEKEIINKNDLEGIIIYPAGCRAYASFASCRSKTAVSVGISSAFPLSCTRSRRRKPANAL